MHLIAIDFFFLLYCILSFFVFCCLLLVYRVFGCDDPLSSWASLKFHLAAKEGRRWRRREEKEGLSVFSCSSHLRTGLNSSRLCPQVLKPVVSPEVNHGLGNRRLINFSLSGRTPTSVFIFPPIPVLLYSYTPPTPDPPLDLQLSLSIYCVNTEIEE